MTSGRRFLLAVPGAALLALGLLGLRLQRAGSLEGVVAVALAQGAVYLAAAAWVLSRRPSPLWLVLLVAALLRAPLLLAPPWLSDDVYRYVWDGRVQAAGVNPYRHVPAAPELAPLRDDRIYPNVNRRDYAPTIYPPAAQLFFLATTRVSESVGWMKASILAWETLAVGLLLLLLRATGRPDALVLLYAWHPLPAWELAGSGHLDGAAVACVLAALLARLRGRPALAGAALGVATLVKLYPAALLPALWRPGDRRLPAALAATVLAGYLPYLGAGSAVLGFLPGYVEEEGLAGGSRYWLLRLAHAAGAPLPAAAYLAVAGLALGALALWVALRRRPADDFAGASLLVATAAVLAFSPHYAWYAVWLLPLAALRSHIPVLVLGVLVFLLYLFRTGAELWVEGLVYVPFALLALAWARRPAARARGALEAAGGA